MEKAKTLIIWEAPARPYKKGEKRYLTKLLAVLLPLVIFLVFAGQFTIIIVLLALLFVSYALYAVPPGKATYTIFEDGIEFGEEKVLFSDIDSFHLGKELGQTVVNIDLKKAGLIKRRFLLFDKIETKDKVLKILREKLTERNLQKEETKVTKYVKKLGLSLKE